MRLAPAIIILVSCVSAQDVRLVQIATGLGTVTDIQDPGDGSGRLFFVLQNGVIRIFRNGALVSQPFLNIGSKITSDGERGLLGLAFPPGFAQKQRFYVDYTDLSGNTVIAQYRVSSNPDVADAGSEIALLHITQPFTNHKGGEVRFGPDGYLYIGMGDGGSAGDPQHNGQSLTTLLGKLLRIDVESSPGSVRIPPDNPFVNNAGARPEIWAYGLRNPWRFAFDRANGDLWIADVGQDMYEEVDYQPASSKGGENYGWNIMEGLHCFAAFSCNTAGLTPPIVEYTHDDGCSITGGFVYRGQRSPGLRGIYFYGDYCSGKIWGIQRQGNTWVNQLLLSTNLLITTFGEDSAGDLYVGDASKGTVLRVEGSAAPRFTSAGLTNSASFVSGLVAGSLATVFAQGVLDDPGVLSAPSVPLPGDLGGVSITVDGIQAPILALGNVSGVELVNFQVPFEIAGRSTVSVTVSRSGQSSTVSGIPVMPVQPGIYTSNGTQALVVHVANYSLVNGNAPLDRGEFAYLYGEGLGTVKNQPATGSAAPSSPLAAAAADVQVKLAGIQCDVQYAGLAPGSPGVYVVNFRVPANALSGSQDLVVTAAGVASPAVKVFVR
ncbi:MAG: Glucose/sorbosone dehydrogenase-like protein [Bryobacterales bacterium]|nr:Glucose/sorbosone dehydrogenase-like protein [Bryobacterales bacterium]